MGLLPEVLGTCNKLFVPVIDNTFTAILEALIALVASVALVALEALEKLVLFSTKDDIVNYAKKNKLTWREDKSNFENKYLRNKIRNIIIPKIKLADPCYRTNFIRLINESNKLKDIVVIRV